MRFRGLSVILPMLLLPSPLAALSPATKAYLVSIGIDPGSRQVAIAAADGEVHTIFHGDPEVFSIEKLAAQKRANALRRFIFTRSLMREIGNPAFKWPCAEYPDYDGDFLTPAERLKAAKLIAESIARC